MTGAIDETASQEDEVNALINGAIDTTRREVGQLRILISPTRLVACTATLIGTHTLLTAAHCVSEAGVTAAPETVTFHPFNGQRYLVKDVAVAPGYTGRPPSADFAVLTLAEDITDVTPLRLLERAPIVGETVLLVGFGDIGTNIDGGDRRRSGTNTVAFLGNASYRMNGASGSATGLCLGDSGGPTLMTEAGELRIGGVHSTSTCDRLAFAPVDKNYSVDARVDVGRDFIRLAASDNLYLGDAPDQQAPALEARVADQRDPAIQAGELVVSYQASDDIVVDKVLFFVNGELVYTQAGGRPSVSGALSIPSPQPGTDGKIWIQVSAFDRAGHRSNFNQYL